MSTVAAIVVAAGPGSRLGADRPKGFVELAGTPLLIRSMRALLAAPSIVAVVAVVPPTELERGRSVVDRHGPWPRPISVVAGGAARRDSVRNGLAAVGSADLIAIHDAARPLISPQVVEAVIAAADRYGAAIVATPATDTIKQVDPDGRIGSTLPRQYLWLAQTPQVFRSALIRAAHARSAGPLPITDDAMLVEQLGERVYVVPGNPENRKITTRDDLRWAEWLLAASTRS